MPEFVINSFSKGWLDDATLDRDKIYSLKRLINTDINYERGALVRRGGYQRAHSANLPAVPKQVYEFVDTAGQPKKLAISNGKLYRVESTVNYEIKNYSVTDSYPIGRSMSFGDNYYPFKTIGDRVFFADDNDWYWADYNALDTNKCYQAGIDKPTELINGTNADLIKYTPNIVSEGTLTPGMKLSQPFTVTETIVVDAVRLHFRLYEVGISPPTAASLIVGIYTNSGGQPDDEIISTRRTMEDMDEVATDVKRLDFPEKTTLTAGTYHLVVEPSTEYTAWYIGGIQYATVQYSTEGDDSLLYWNGTVWQTFPAPGRQLYYIIGGGLTENTVYKYTYTLYNSTHKIESAQMETDEKIGEIVAVPYYQSYKLTMPASPADTQATQFRLYRTKSAGNVFYHLADVTIATSVYWDVIDDDNLGAQLQSYDHQRLQDADENLLKPHYLEHWHNRLFAVPVNSNTLYFSKQLEERGSLGVTGDMIYDYYPAENYWTLDSEIRAVKVLEDRLIVYTSNNNVHVFDGGFSPLNPPPDLAKQEIIIGENCYDARTLYEMQGRHIFVTQNKFLKAFNGSAQLEDVGEGIEDSLRLAGGKYCATVYKNQYVLGVDADGDSVIESLYILDLSHPLPTFRAYQYIERNGEVMKIYDLHTTRDAVLYACPSDIQSSAYRVVQLDSGYSDDWTDNESDGVDITKIIQTHFLMPARRAKWTRFSMKGYYPSGAIYGQAFYGDDVYGGDAVIPQLTVTVFGKNGEFSQATLSPASSEDSRGHNCGIRIASEECSVRIDSVGDKPDEIREIKIEWRF